MQTKSSAATTARPTTPTQAAALPPAAPPTETTMAQIVGCIPLKVSAKERPARPAPTTPAQRPQRPAAPTPTHSEIARKAVKDALKALSTAADLAEGEARTAAISAALSTFRAACSATWHVPTLLGEYSIDRFLDLKGLRALSRKVGGREVVMTSNARRRSAAERRESRDHYLARKREEIAALTAAANVALEAAKAAKNEARAAAIAEYRQARKIENQARLEASKKKEEVKAKRREARKAEREEARKAEREEARKAEREGKKAFKAVISNITSKVIYLAGGWRLPMKEVAQGVALKIGEKITVMVLAGRVVTPLPFEVENKAYIDLANKIHDAETLRKRVIEKASAAYTKTIELRRKAPSDRDASLFWEAHRGAVRRQNEAQARAFRGIKVEA